MNMNVSENADFPQFSIFSFQFKIALIILLNAI